jgi:carboxyl-terminal processing protease
VTRDETDRGDPNVDDARRSQGVSHAVDDTDWLKTAAIIFVAIGHFGYFFIEDDTWWSVFGRLAAPAFFFLSGYARGRAVPLSWIGLGVILTVLDSWNSDWAWVAPNILLSFAFIRFARPRVERLLERYGWAAFVVLVCGLLAVLPLAAKCFDYGSEGWLWALFGLYQRRYVDGAAAAQLAGASSPGLASQPSSATRTNANLIRLAACVVAAAVYVWQEQKEFSFPPIPFAIFVLELAALSVCLCLFRRGPSRLQPPESAAGIVRFIGRRTLLIYAVQLAGSELLVNLLPDRAQVDSLAPPAGAPLPARAQVGSLAPSVVARDHSQRRMTSDPEKNFEALWKTFNNRYPFFELRNVDWNEQYEIYRPQVTSETSDEELFDVLRRMLDPLNDGHVELKARLSGYRKPRRFTAEKQPAFHREFSSRERKQLLKTTEKTLTEHGFGKPEQTAAWMLHYSRSAEFGYLRILELEGIGKRTLAGALDRIARDFDGLKGFIIDIRDNPGGDDSTAIAIINRFCDRKRVAFRRKTKIGPGRAAFTPVSTWHLHPQGDAQFTGPIVLLTSDSVFSGGEAFALAIRQLPYVTIVGDHTNGIFSYQLEKKLPNGWEYCLSYQVYLSADHVCYEGRGVPADIELLNTKADIARGVDPLITRALEVLKG